MNCGSEARSNSVDSAERSKERERVRACRRWAFRAGPSCTAVVPCIVAAAAAAAVVVVAVVVVVAIVAAAETVAVGGRRECRWASGCPPDGVEKEARCCRKSRDEAGPWSCWASSFPSCQRAS